jgi:hypothetical protein
MVLYCVAVSHAAGNPVEMKVLSEEERKSPEYKDINMTGKFPLLQTPEGSSTRALLLPSTSLTVTRPSSVKTSGNAPRLTSGANGK